MHKLMYNILLSYKFSSHIDLNKKLFLFTISIDLVNYNIIKNVISVNIFFKKLLSALKYDYSYFIFSCYNESVLMFPINNKL